MPLKKTEVEVINESGMEVPVDEKLALKCIGEVARQDACSFSFIEIVYVGEEKIQQVNNDHLGHDYITDIITFRYDEILNNINIEGTLFCCAPRISEQAIEYNQDIGDEYIRVLIHGLLHLAGYDDKSEQERETMRARENHYLALLK